MSNKATLYGVVGDGVVEWLNPSIARSVFAKLRGKSVEITVEKLTRKRSLDQNAYYWQIPIEICFGIYKAEGNDMDKEAVHEDLMRRFAPREPIVMKGEVNGYKLTRTSRMTTVEMNEYFEKIAEWLAIDYGVIMPPPDPNWKINKKKRP